ncbi:rna-directed dna polymerase from mobile element jockey [Lasius niger]|uniref:Rna-directed dna polymerase from mobile element jockey n=1 Tax=Lasius niger TaxID=67767 RepID=A0A0J7K5C6_LASNI|nr:rna-directed dna polymerase from mobile element jockey [Lasius niger]
MDVDPSENSSLRTALSSLINESFPKSTEDPDSKLSRNTTVTVTGAAGHRDLSIRDRVIKKIKQPSKRYGHIKQNCKGYARCVNCGERDHGDGVACSRSDPHCVNCKGDHPANSSSCPELVTQKEIRMVSAYRNITLLDTNAIVRGHLSSSPPYSGSLDDFPQSLRSGKISDPPFWKRNCHSIRNKKEAIANVINDYNLLAFSETWLDDNVNISFRDFNILRSDGPSSKSGGLLLAIKRYIPYLFVEGIYQLEGFLETLAVSVPSSTGSILIISIYRHPHNPPVPFSQIWENLINSCSDFSHVILTGDFNAHHPSWSSCITDASGRAAIM